jgi:hypothetical protein
VTSVNWASLTCSPALTAALTEDAFRRLLGVLGLGSGVGLPVGDAPAGGVGSAEAVGSAEGAGSGLLLAEGVGVGLGDGHRIGTGMTQPGWVTAAAGSLAGPVSSTRPRPSEGGPARRGRGRCWPASRPGPGVQPKLSEAPVTPSSMPNTPPMPM